MEWAAYGGLIRRRWLILAVIVALDLIAAGASYARSRHAAGYQACGTLYLADVSAPSLIAAPPTSLEAAGELLAGETAANFFGDDILDVASSRSVASFISAHLSGQVSSSTSDIYGQVTGSRRDRTVSLCVNNANSATALAADRVLTQAMSADRARFVGKNMAGRTFVSVVSPASVATVPASSSRLRLALEFVLGLLIAGGVALLWDAFDANVRDEHDVERILGVRVTRLSR